MAQQSAQDMRDLVEQGKAMPAPGDAPGRYPIKNRQDLQNAILAVCSSLLADTGVAYISYNTYPGWKAKEIVRDAMLLSVDDTASPPEKVVSARRMGEFLHDVAQPDSVLARAVADHRAMASVSASAWFSPSRARPAA